MADCQPDNTLTVSPERLTDNTPPLGGVCQSVSVSEITDFDRVQRALAGDMTANEELYLRYATFCRSYARRIGAELDEADDVVQELFLRLAQGRGWRLLPHQLPPGGALNAWLAGAIKHMIRTKQRDRGLGTGGDPEFAGQVLEAAPVWPIHTDNPEDKALRFERMERLRWALASLGQRQRQIAHLRYFECLSGPQIAEQLRITDSTVFQTLYQIREALRPRLSCVYQLPDKAPYGYVKFGAHRGALANRPRNHRDEKYRSRRRRERTLAREVVA